MAKKLVFKRRERVKKPLWKLEDGITFSALSKWCECREQFALQWIDGLSPKELNIALEFGSVFHYALENQAKASPDEVIAIIAEHYYKYREKTCKSSAERDKLGYLLSLAQTVFPRYCKYWEHDDKELVWIGKEEKFLIPYKLVDVHGEERDIVLRGMRDGIYSNTTGSVYGVFETKTKSRIVERDIIDNLQYDMQTMLYCYCTFLSTGIYPNQIKYNVVRRPDIYQRKGENVLDYMRRVGEDIDLRPDHYFKRYKASISKQDLELFKTRTLDPILRLFVEWWDSIKKNPLQEEVEGNPGRWSSKYHFLNSSALVGKYGKVEMWDAIFGDMRRYKTRDQIFPELEDCFQVTFA